MPKSKENTCRMEQSIQYTFRKSVLEQAKTYKLTQDSVTVTEQGNTAFAIPYNQIHSIRLYYQPQRFRTNNYVCKVQYNNGSMLIKSTSYTTVGHFADLSYTYTPFVKELVKITLQKNLNAKVYSGNTFALYWLYVFITTATVLGLAAFFTFFPVFAGFGFIVSILVIAYYLFYSLKMFVRNYPKRVPNGTIPDTVLPKK